MSIGQSLDLSGYNLKRLSQIPKSASFKTGAVLVLTLDDNCLSSLDGLSSYTNVVQLSATNNCLADVKELQHLHDVVLLNLQGNSLFEIPELSYLTKLQWLSLANNNFKVFHSLQSNHLLTHLDLSNNSLKSVPDLSVLTNLSTLLLAGNMVTSMQYVHFPSSLKSLSLADNKIHDINHFSFLSHLQQLEQLSVQRNPCFVWKNESVNYRLFMLFWCKQLVSLDDSSVGDSERSLACILFPRGKCPFTVGRHSEAMQYLIQIEPHLLSMTKVPTSGVQTAHVRHSQAHTHKSAHSISHTPQDTTELSSIAVSQQDSSQDPATLCTHPVSSIDSPVDMNQMPLNSSGCNTTQEAMTENSPDVSAQDKLKIIRRLNRVISDHRKNVGVNSVFGDVDDTNQGSEPTSKGSQSNTGGGGSAPVFGSTSVHIPLMVTNWSADAGKDDCPLPADLTQLSVTHSYSTKPALHSRPEITPTESETSEDSSTCTDSTVSTIEDTYTDHDKGCAAVVIQAWWRGGKCRAACREYKRQYCAARIIQSVWRGFRARSHDQKAVVVRSLLRQRKMESYIVHCLHHLRGCQVQLAHNTQVIQLQEETLHGLLSEVESLTRWKEEMEGRTLHTAATTIQKHWRGALARRSNPKVPLLLAPVKQIVALSKSKMDQEKIIKEDNNEVHLKVFQEHSMQPGLLPPLVSEGSRTEPSSHLRSLLDSNRLLTPPNLGSTEGNPLGPSFLQGNPAPGASAVDTSTPTMYSVHQQNTNSTSETAASNLVEPNLQQTNLPPSSLHMSHYSPTCLLLQWDATHCNSATGFNIYVNGSLEGTVGPSRNKAYLDGLDTTASYRIYVRAVYSDVESNDSNPVIASVKKVPKVNSSHVDQLPILSSGNGTGQDQVDHLPILSSENGTHQDQLDHLSILSSGNSTHQDQADHLPILSSGISTGQDQVDQLPKLSPVNGTHQDQVNHLPILSSENGTHQDQLDHLPILSSENGTHQDQVDHLPILSSGNGTHQDQADHLPILSSENGTHQDQADHLSILSSGNGTGQDQPASRILPVLASLSGEHKPPISESPILTVSSTPATTTGGDVIFSGLNLVPKEPSSDPSLEKETTVTEFVTEPSLQPEKKNAATTAFSVGNKEVPLVPSESTLPPPTSVPNETQTSDSELLSTCTSTSGTSLEDSLDLPKDSLPVPQDHLQQPQPDSKLSPHTSGGQQPANPTSPSQDSTVSMSSIMSANLTWDDIPGMLTILTPTDVPSQDKDTQSHVKLPLSPIPL